MKARILFTLFLLALSAANLKGNGGPVVVNTVFKTSDIQLLDKQDIAILKENLSVIIEGDSTLVKVEYLFRNSGETADLLYGFPVDYFLKPTVGEVTWDRIIDGWNSSYITNCSIADETGRLKPGENYEEKVYQDTLPVDNMFYRKIDVARKWIITKLHFEKGKEKKVTVNYTIANYVFDMMMSDMYFLMYSERVFTYDFTPAGYFGSGRIGEFNLDIDLSVFTSANCPCSVWLGEKLETGDGRIKLSKKNFDLKNAPKLRVIYKPDNIYKAQVPDRYRIGAKSSRFFRSSALTGKKDSVQAALLDGNCRTVWKGLKATGDWLEIGLKKDSISYIGIINGNTADSASYYDYPRIKKLRIELGSRTIKGYLGTNKLEVDLPDKDYRYFNAIYFGSFLTTLFDLGMDFYDDLKTVKLTILDVYPGRKYDTPCISELYIYKFRGPAPAIIDK